MNSLPRTVRADGNRAVAAGGNIEGDVFTGDITIVSGTGRHPATVKENLRILTQRLLADLRRDQVQQQLRSGQPLPLHCRAAPSELTGPGSGVREISVALADATPLDLTGRLGAFAAVYLKKRRSQLMVLGRAGSGKSVLVRRFAQARLEDGAWAEKGPVPVIFSLGSWDPTAVLLRDWLVERLERDHPFLARRPLHEGTWAAELVEGGHVLAILDGFDELAEAFHAPALRQLRVHDLPLLVTSRHEALVDVGPGEGLFPGIELTDLTHDDCAARLGSSAAWAPVLSRLSDHPGDPAADRLAAVLATPLMLTMAEAFQASGGAPEDLLGLAETGSRDTVEKHLLDAFVPRSYDAILNLSLPKRRRWSAERAGHWLGYLATHLKSQKTGTQRSDAQDIEWWHLGTTIRLSTRMAVSGVLCGLVSAAAAALLQIFLSGPVLVIVALNALGSGLSFGLMHGFASKLKTAGAFKPSRMQIQIRGESRRARTRRVRECLLPRVGGGLVGGLVFGTVFGSGITLYAVIEFCPCRRLWFSAVMIFGNWLVAGLLIGLGTGFVLALMAWFETDAKPEETVNATALLRTNRTIVLVQAVTAGLVLGLGYGTAVTYFNGFTLGLPSGAAVGLSMTVGVCTLTAWGRWVLLVRFWLPLSGRLPWRVNAFLAEARVRGVLRQAGAVYQFRHARLRDHLAETHQRRGQPTERDGRPGTTARGADGRDGR
ncbi:NACHT domain-containing protein [Streptomyces sp. NPDC058195]|uniref:NACHT domain-containing protein n=1 Tax=Streptomyces sp. NPDC058195 TaxID=3346375 RepID=UPI0036ECFC41